MNNVLNKIYLHGCKNLPTLTGIAAAADYNFTFCDSLNNLKGMPPKIKGKSSIDVIRCSNFKSTKGAPPKM